jgi:hypothetical protein
MFLSAGNQATIANNYIHMISVGYLHDSGWGEGILSQQASGCRAYNNIVVGAKWGFNGPFGADVRNNLYAGFVRGSEVGGVVSSGAIFEDPLFVAGMAPALQPTSPCINAGVSDPIFNDLDGTRNDIGPGGGCFFDPEAWTTDKPIVISFDLGPSELLRGADTLVTLSNGQAVSGK